MKTYYIQVNQNNIITDAIEYEVEGYVVYTTQFPLPQSVISGWYKYENGEIVEIPELNPTSIENRIQAEIDAFTLSLIEMGLL